MPARSGAAAPTRVARGRAKRTGRPDRRRFRRQGERARSRSCQFQGQREPVEPPDDARCRGGVFGDGGVPRAARTRRAKSSMASPSGRGPTSTKASAESPSGSCWWWRMRAPLTPRSSSCRRRSFASSMTCSQLSRTIKVLRPESDLEHAVAGGNQDHRGRVGEADAAADRTCDGIPDLSGRGGCQFDDDDLFRLPRDLHCESGLARAARPQDRDEPARWSVDCG